MEDERNSAGPVVVSANWYRFRRSERIHHDRVMSVCFLWALEGVGLLDSSGHKFEVTPSCVLRLPWGHDVTYMADARSPFHLGTVHVVPRHDHADPVMPQVAHLSNDPLFDAKGRADEPHGQRGPRWMDAASGAGRRVASLGSLTIERLHHRDFNEEIFRALGVLFMDDNANWDRPDQQAPSAPPAVETMTAYIAQHLAAGLTVADVARAGDCSPATAQRLFGQHIGRSVSAYVRALRMKEAATLLRTSGMQVREVAQTVGFDDPLYFSRVFRRNFGMPPSRYARKQIRP